jgi:subtilisin family serine protease
MRHPCLNARGVVPFYRLDGGMMRRNSTMCKTVSICTAMLVGLLGTAVPAAAAVRDREEPAAKRPGLAGSAATEPEQEKLRERPAYHPSRIVVTYRPGATQDSPHLLLRSGRSVGSGSLATVHRKFAKDVVPVFRTPKEEAALKGPQTEAALEIYHYQKLEAAKGRRSMKGTKALRAPLPDLSRTYTIDLKPGTSVEEAVEEFNRLPETIAQPDYLVETLAIPNDPYFSSGASWDQPYGDLWGLQAIHVDQAWDVTRGEGVVVAVVDSGANYNHEDLRNNIWVNPAMVPDQNGDGRRTFADVLALYDANYNDRIDPGELPAVETHEKAILGWDVTTCETFGQSECDVPKVPGPDPIDQGGHGTHVAGTIAATGDNGIGVIGVAPRATIMPIKAFNAQGIAYTSELAGAVVTAAELGADIINNSWGCGVPCPENAVAEQAVQTAYAMGAVVVFAAGNSTRHVYLDSPQNQPEVITVAATDHRDRLTDFSNFGAEVDVAAPGGESGFYVQGQLQLQAASILSLRAEGTEGIGLGRPLCRLRIRRGAISGRLGLAWRRHMSQALPRSCWRAFLRPRSNRCGRCCGYRLIRFSRLNRTDRQASAGSM